MREKEIEKKLTQMVKQAGGICPKLVSPGFDGPHGAAAEWTDRLC